MPMSKAFRNRLEPILPQVIAEFGTPFHLYDEQGIRATGERLKRAFQDVAGFKEFFAVKALSNPAILTIMHELGFGFDCSSIPELNFAREVGATPTEIMFSSNNTSQAEYRAALAHGGCILNLDDISYIAKVPKPFPELICFRYNPGHHRPGGNPIIGTPTEAKYGVPHEEIVDAYCQARGHGAKRFGIHTMIVSNERNPDFLIQTCQMLLEVIKMIALKLGIRFEFINIGGGWGIAYQPEHKELPVEEMARRMKALLDAFKKSNGYAPALYLESGRWVTGPHGVLVTTCINIKNTYKTFIGVDACCTSSMMRPAMYWGPDHPNDGWHFISVLGKEGGPTQIVNVVGSACENNDQFAHDRQLPHIKEGDHILVHDTGAHCWVMANNYNNRLRVQELLLGADGTVKLIRRAETEADLRATLNFKPKIFKPRQ